MQNKRHPLYKSKARALRLQSPGEKSVSLNPIRQLKAYQRDDLLLELLVRLLPPDDRAALLLAPDELRCIVLLRLLRLLPDLTVGLLFLLLLPDLTAGCLLVLLLLLTAGLALLLLLRDTVALLLLRLLLGLTAG